MLLPCCNDKAISQRLVLLAVVTEFLNLNRFWKIYTGYFPNVWISIDAGHNFIIRGVSLSAVALARLQSRTKATMEASHMLLYGLLLIVLVGNEPAAAQDSCPLGKSSHVNVAVGSAYWGFASFGCVWILSVTCRTIFRQYERNLQGLWSILPRERRHMHRWVFPWHSLPVSQLRYRAFLMFSYRTYC